MIKNIFNCSKKYFLLSLLLLFSIQLINAQKSITSGHISFEFVSKKVDGSISGFTTASSIDVDNLAASYFEGSVAVASIKTGNFLRDWALKGGKYFDEDNYPRITFKSKQVKVEGDIIKVDGDLTIKDTTKPITIDFTIANKKLTGTTTLFSWDYGIKIKKKREDNKVDVVLTFELE